MTAPARELFANNAISALDSSIDDSTTTLVVTDGGRFPSTGNFRVIVGSEIMLATARSGNTLTVLRGQEGTAAASHGVGTAVTHSFTVGSFERWARDNKALWGYGRPMGKIVADDGQTPLTASDFNWQNQGTSTAQDQAGTILLTTEAASGLQMRILERAAPAPPFAYIASFRVAGPASTAGAGSSTPAVSFGFRESGTGKLVLTTLGTSGDFPSQLRVNTWNSSSVFVANVRATLPFALISDAFWAKISDDGTNLNFYVGADSENWILLHSMGRTSFMAGGADRVCWAGQQHNGTENTMLVRLVHWSRE